MGILIALPIGLVLFFSLGVVAITNFKRGNLGRAWFWVTVFAAVILAAFAYSWAVKTSFLFALPFGFFTLLLNPSVLMPWIPLGAPQIYKFLIWALIWGVLIFSYRITEPKPRP